MEYMTTGFFLNYKVESSQLTVFHEKEFVFGAGVEFKPKLQPHIICY